MSRYTGPVGTICRREGTRLYLKAEKCFTDQCPMARRPVLPGLLGQDCRKLSEYGVQLREKQKARRTYGVMEGQFGWYFEKAAKNKQQSVTDELLLQTWEWRLDNVVYRLGPGSTRKEVRHGHFQSNGRRVTIPSFTVKSGEGVEVRDLSRQTSRSKLMGETTSRLVGRELGGLAWYSVAVDQAR